MRLQLSPCRATLEIPENGHKTWHTISSLYYLQQQQNCKYKLIVFGMIKSMKHSDGLMKHRVDPPQEPLKALRIAKEK
jgi:hypothetical protein